MPNTQEQIRFTTRVLGPVAAYRLEQHQLTQTLRSESDSVTNAILKGRYSAGEKLGVTLDGRLVGHAAFISMDEVTWDILDIDDAHRGGFGSRFDLGQALRRAGFRFMPMNDYQLYRIQFRWLEEAYA